ncbi:hypothetical protein J1605_016598 [Eschrichtius robustus]|uniref:Uncharacterized protein n=1 Tax=Eschrichtius robustus TaxID=9764 RepID=A0AB34I5T7_ESCRO|nr:hypothetical protein J1605_016598 [Eschrichtius robustus]
MAANVGSMFQYWKRFDLQQLQVRLLLARPLARGWGLRAVAASPGAPGCPAAGGPRRRGGGGPRWRREPPPPPLPPVSAPTPGAPPALRRRRHRRRRRRGTGEGAAPAVRGVRARAGSGRRAAAAGAEPGGGCGPAAAPGRAPRAPGPPYSRGKFVGSCCGGEAPASPGGAAAATAAGAAELGLVALWCRRLGGGSERPPAAAAAAAAAARPGSGQAGGWPGGRPRSPAGPGPAAAPSCQRAGIAPPLPRQAWGAQRGPRGLFTSGRVPGGHPQTPQPPRSFVCLQERRGTGPSAAGDPGRGAWGNLLGAAGAAHAEPGCRVSRGRGYGRRRRTATFPERRPGSAPGRAVCPGRGCLLPGACPGGPLPAPRGSRGPQ